MYIALFFGLVVNQRVVEEVFALEVGTDNDFVDQENLFWNFSVGSCYGNALFGESSLHENAVVKFLAFFGCVVENRIRQDNDFPVAATEFLFHGLGAELGRLDLRTVAEIEAVCKPLGAREHERLLESRHRQFPVGGLFIGGVTLGPLVRTGASRKEKRRHYQQCPEALLHES